MNFELFQWYSTEDHNLQYSLIPWKQDILEYDQAVLLEFENGLIEVDRYFYYRDNMELGHQYPVKRFMIIQL